MTTPCPNCFAAIASSVVLLAVFFGLLVIAAIKDVRTMTIPNSISLVMVALYPGFVAVAGIDWLDGLLAGAVVFAVGLVLFALGWLGGGDVKLLAATSLWAGTGLLLPALFVTAIAGGALCIFVWLRHGGIARIYRRLFANDSQGAASVGGSGAAVVAETEAVVPYAVAIFAGGAFVAIAQFMPIWRLAETAL